MTNSLGTLERAVMISSVIPSQRNSCFGSSLIFTKGNTAIEGTSGNGNAIFSLDAISSGGAGLKYKLQIATTAITKIKTDTTMNTGFCHCLGLAFFSPIT